ncbi:MAG: RseA family anti-sigma factor [Pseudomonadota bacterium]
MSEKISQLVDRELEQAGRADVISEIASSEASLNSWKHYHLIGSVIRGEITSAGNDLSAQIADALEAEPTVLAPVSFQSGQNAAPEKSSGSGSVIKSAGLFALAASVALVAVTVLKPSTVEVTQPSSVAAVEVTDNEARERALFEQELGEMLAEHGEFSSSAGLNGLIAYAKLVSAAQIDE